MLAAVRRDWGMQTYATGRAEHGALACRLVRSISCPVARQGQGRSLQISR